MLINLAIGFGIVALLAWSAWDAWKQFRLERGGDSSSIFTPPAPSKLEAIRSAEEFRSYCKSEGFAEAHRLTGQAVASLFAEQPQPEGFRKVCKSELFAEQPEPVSDGE